MLIACFFFLITSVCIYGIGINRVVVLSEGKKGLVLSFVKSILSTVATVCLTFLITQYLLIPIGLQEIYPMVCILIFCFIAAFFEGMIRLTAKEVVSEFFVSFMCSLLAINESISLTESVLFVICCITAFYLLIPILFAVRKRNDSANSVPVFKGSLILFSLAAIILWLLVFDVSWLTGGITR